MLPKPGRQRDRGSKGDQEQERAATLHAPVTFPVKEGIQMPTTDSEYQKCIMTLGIFSPGNCIVQTECVKEACSAEMIIFRGWSNKLSADIVGQPHLKAERI